MNDFSNNPGFAEATPPVIEQRPSAQSHHGQTLTDAYAWLRADNWRDVLRDPAALPTQIRDILLSENRYTDAVLAPTASLQKKLLAELKSRIDPDDSDVPMPDGPFSYYTRFRQDGQHQLFCRIPRDGGAEDVLLDGDALAEGKAFFDIGDAGHSNDHRFLWWSADIQGSEFYTIRVRELSRNADLPDVIEQTDGSAVWDPLGTALYYVRMDENHRPMQVWRHRLGTPASADELVFEERDPAWFVGLERSAEGRHAIIVVKDHDSTECHLVDLSAPWREPHCVAPREKGVRYSIEPHGDQLFILTNRGGADDFRIMTAPLAQPGSENWRDLIAEHRGCFILAFSVYRDFMVRVERENCLPHIVVRSFADGSEFRVDFPEEAYSLEIDDMLEFDTQIIRFDYSSMTTPTETYDFDIHTRARTLRKRKLVPSGHQAENYVTKRLFAPTADGELVPVTLLYRRDCLLPAPLLLYGYGAYGHAMPAHFSTNRLSLVDRGFVYAIAHVRGGTDKGWNWYKTGKLEHKLNTFTDFLASAEYLIDEGVTQTGMIVAQGGSAGGMLMGAIANMAPHLFAGIVADVPFVDVLNTMLDASLPLTPPEWLEWGNPIDDAEAFARMKAYSPYDNVTAQAYPPILALAGLTDPRVTYWEPLKWVAKLREFSNGGGPILIKTNMDAGHAGASGRFDQLEEVALIQAFALAACGLVNR